MLVVDCAQAGDGTVEWMRENNVVLEVDYQTAVRWGTVGRGIEVQAIFLVTQQRGKQ